MKNRTIYSVFALFVLLVLTSCGFQMSKEKDASTSANNNIGNDLNKNDTIDNSSYYSISLGHPIAESEDGFYFTFKGVLFFSDKKSLNPIVLSADNYSWNELNENKQLMQESDAFVGDDCKLFYIKDKLFSFSLAGYYSFPKEGGARKQIAKDLKGQVSCITYVKGKLYFIKNINDEEGGVVSSLVRLDPDKDKIEELGSFPEELCYGKNVNEQKMFPMGEKIIAEFILPDERDNENVIYYYDVNSGKEFIFKNILNIEGKNYASQVMTVDRERLMSSVCQDIPQNEKPNAKLIFRNLDGKIIDTEEEMEINWPQVCISNGKDRYEVPSPVTWISKSFNMEGELDENSKVKLRIKNLKTGKETLIDEKLIKKGTEYMCSVSSEGWCLIYGNDKLLIINEEGLHLITPEGHELIGHNHEYFKS